MQQSYDYIIVGQGIAGSLLAFLLEEEGQRILVVDQGHETSSSRVAAGTINPITGRKYVKSWMVDELLPAARSIYGRMSESLGISTYTDSRILRVLFTPEDENTWLSRSADPLAAQYMIDPADASECEGKLIGAPAYGELTGCMQVHMPAILQAMRARLADKGCLLEEVLDYEAILSDEDWVRYKGFRAKGIIFAEGAAVRNNPYFNSISWQPVKGEVLHIRIAGAPFSKVVRHRIFITHLYDDVYWVGARYIHKYDDHRPTEAERHYLIAELDSILTVPYTVVDHQAGIRPAVSGRRPVMGRHPLYPNLIVCNGLGTKGASLGPYFIDSLVQYLLYDKPMIPEVSRLLTAPH